MAKSLYGRLVRRCKVRISMATRSASASSFLQRITRISSPTPISLHSCFSNACGLLAINTLAQRRMRLVER
ncbi:hypothetical protein D9M73_174230 [compost metagenome]